MASVKVNIINVLNRLREALGTGESPPRSNNNFIVQWYNSNVDRIGRGPWCEMTATWAMWTGGAKILKTGRAYTVWAAQDAEDGARGSSWHYGVRGMRAGDQVYYDWSRRKGDLRYVDHTGIVEKVNGDGTFYVLEGNTSANLLQRMLRDSTYVVGYTRFNWDALPDVKPVPPIRPPTPRIPNRQLTMRVQDALEVSVDGKWGATTDEHGRRMRAAARAHVGYPRRVPARFDISKVQRIIDTTPDGEWGPRSQASMNKWVKEFQRALGVMPDGQWGPNTDVAYLAARKQNLNNF